MPRFENKENLIVVRSSKASLLKAFIEECENIGWKYVDSFTDRSRVDEYTTQVGKEKCLYFSTGFARALKSPGFALSSSRSFAGEEVYNLDTQFILALDAAKVAYDMCRNRDIIIKNISKDYDATVTEKGIVVGCQTISFEKFEEISKAVAEFIEQQ